MDIAIPLFDRFTALDAIGPYETLSRLPGARVTFVAARPGPVLTDNRMLSIVAERGLDELRSPDIVVVPGGIGSRAMMADTQLIDWVRAAHETTQWTCSVCTGSLVLGAAGRLRGKRATTHHLSYDLLATYGATLVKERVVDEGQLVTAGGVTSGLDLGVHLVRRIYGSTVASAIASQMEMPNQG